MQAARPALVERERPDGSAKIRETVRGWDKHETADRIELDSGRDLQCIRINGTLGGGVVGLRIDSLSHGLFSGFSSPGPRRRGGPIRWRLWLASRWARVEAVFLKNSLFCPPDRPRFYTLMPPYCPLMALINRLSS